MCLPFNKDKDSTIDKSKLSDIEISRPDLIFNKEDETEQIEPLTRIQDEDIE